MKRFLEAQTSKIVSFPLLLSYRMIPDLATEASGTSACFLALGRALALFWGLSVDLLASLECFAFDLGPSDPDFARRGSPQDALGIVFGGRNGVIWKISGECTGFVHRSLLRTIFVCFRNGFPIV